MSKNKNNETQLNFIFKSLPKDYLKFVRGKTTQIIENEQNVLTIFSKSEAIEYNIDIETVTYWTNRFFIGQTELAIMVGFNLENQSIICNPMISDPNDSLELAESFTQFLVKFNNSKVEIY